MTSSREDPKHPMHQQLGQHPDVHPQPGLVGHEHQVAVHAGHDQATEQALAERASTEGLAGDGGAKDPEGYPVHAGHAHVAGTDGPQGDEPGAEDNDEGDGDKPDGDRDTGKHDGSNQN